MSKPREQWKFIGREKHYGFEYLVWVLVKNPRGRFILGNRYVQVVK